MDLSIRAYNSSDFEELELSLSSMCEVCDRTTRNSKIGQSVECTVEAKRGSLSRQRQNTGQIIYAAEVGSRLTSLY